MLKYLELQKDSIDVVELPQSEQDSIDGYLVHRFYYNENGYCSMLLFDKIVSYWKHSFNKPQDVIEFARGNHSLDFQGGRKYFLTKSKIAWSVFCYLKAELQWSCEEFESKICNSMELTDTLEQFFEIAETTSDFDEIQAIYGKLYC